MMQSSNTYRSSTCLLLLLFLALLRGTPTWAEGGKSQIPLADPYILLDGGKYYAYGTHDASGIRCYSSDDLRSWKDEGQALNKANTTEQQWFWAPEVYHVGDKYIMYFSANEHLFAATATSPTGPFKQVGSYQMEKLIGDEKCIDSSVFFDDDGKAYIFFVRFTDGNCIWQAQLEDDYITPVEGTLKKCIAVSQDWEKKMGRVCEGPNIIKSGKRYYLTYSGNDYRSQDYGVGFAYSTNIASGSWTKYSNNPILHRWDDLVGTGHHSLFYDKEGILRIVFHAHNSKEEVGTRLMYIGTMKLSSSRLYMSNEPVIRPTLQDKPYNPELVTKTWGFEGGGAISVDLNNDGFQDIVASGAGNDVQNAATDPETSKRMTYVTLFSSSTNKWNKVSATPPFCLADSPTLIPCDINNDGRMDIIAFEQTGTDTEAEAYTGDYGREGIFLGNGTGTFTTATLHFTDSEGTPYPFDIKGPSGADIIDIDNDGLLDIVCAGHQGDVSYNVVLHNQGGGADGIHFVVEPYESDFLLSNANVQVADLNNDGYQDFVISASVDNNAEQVRFTDVYLNDTLHHGRFIRQMLGEKGADIKRKSHGALALADLNNDGWTDIFLAGLGETSSGESTTRQRIYINKQEHAPHFTNAASELTTDIYNISSTSSNAAGIIDWNGDGYYDLLIGGYKGNAKTTSGQLYLNDGNGRPKRAALIPGVSGGTVLFPDWNGDGRKDYVANGSCTDANYLTTEQTGRNAILCYNLYPTPQRPDAPTDCQATPSADGSVVLSWQAPATAKACFTYEVYIKDADGRLVNSVPAFVGGTNSGLRKANLKGRVGCLCSWEFRPKSAGTYTWGVQTVDAAYTGSVFAEGPAFTVEDNSDGIHAAASANASRNATYYNIDGKRTTKPQQGLHIIQDHQGTRKAFF